MFFPYLGLTGTEEGHLNKIHLTDYEPITSRWLMICWFYTFLKSRINVELCFLSHLRNSKTSRSSSNIQRTLSHKNTTYNTPSLFLFGDVFRARLRRHESPAPMAIKVDEESHWMTFLSSKFCLTFTGWSWWLSINTTQWHNVNATTVVLLVFVHMYTWNYICKVVLM